MNKDLKDEYVTLTIKREEDGEIYFVYTSNYLLPGEDVIRKGDMMYDFMLNDYIKKKNETLAEIATMKKSYK